MMSTVRPVKIFSTTIIICMNELVNNYLVDLILNVHVITTYHYLKRTNIEREAMIKYFFPVQQKRKIIMWTTTREAERREKNKRKRVSGRISKQVYVVNYQA